MGGGDGRIGGGGGSFQTLRPFRPASGGLGKGSGGLVRWVRVCVGV